MASSWPSLSEEPIGSTCNLRIFNFLAKLNPQPLHNGHYIPKTVTWLRYKKPTAYSRIKGANTRQGGLTSHGAYIGTLVLIECKKYVLYVIRKRWSSRFRCTAWKNRILGKFVKNAFFVVCDVTIFYQSISCPQTDIFPTTNTFYGKWWSKLTNKERYCQKCTLGTHWLWALISSKEKNPRFYT